MRNIRRAFQRKPFHLWIAGTAIGRQKRRKRFYQLWKDSNQTERLTEQGNKVS